MGLTTFSGGKDIAGLKYDTIGSIIIGEGYPDKGYWKLKNNHTHSDYLEWHPEAGYSLEDYDQSIPMHYTVPHGVDVSVFLATAPAPVIATNP